VVGADPSDSAALRYWNGATWAPVLGSGGATPLKDTTDDLDGTISGGRFSLILDNTSTPRVTDLSGTVFAIGGVNGGAPRIGVRVRAQGFATPGSMRRYVDLDLINSGPGDARHLLITQIAPRTLSGSGTATLDSQTTLPIAIGALDVGATAPVRVYANVPASVTRLSLTLSGSVDAADPPATLNYSTAATVIVRRHSCSLECARRDSPHVWQSWC